MSKTLKSLKGLKGTVVLTEAVPMETELPHKKLARLTAEQTKVTESLQWLKRSFAERNIKAQACRQAVPTSEITHFENEKRELASRLLAIQTEIGSINRELRANKAARQNGKHTEAPPPVVPNGSARSRKERPLKEHPEWSTYFLLAARDELAEGLCAQVERSAKALLQHALDTGIEQ